MKIYIHFDGAIQFTKVFKVDRPSEITVAQLLDEFAAAYLSKFGSAIGILTCTFTDADGSKIDLTKLQLSLLAVLEDKADIFVRPGKLPAAGASTAAPQQGCPTAEEALATSSHPPSSSQKSTDVPANRAQQSIESSGSQCQQTPNAVATGQCTTTTEAAASSVEAPAASAPLSTQPEKSLAAASSASMKAGAAAPQQASKASASTSSSSTAAAGAGKNPIPGPSDTPSVAPLLLAASEAIASKRLRQAEVILLSVLQKAPGHKECLQTLAGLWLAARKPEKALPYAQLAVDAHPGDASLHQLLGRCLHEQREFELAVQQLGIALEAANKVR